MADQDIENKLRNRLVDYEEEPPLGAWAEVEKGLKPSVNYTLLVLSILFISLFIGMVTISYWEPIRGGKLQSKVSKKSSKDIIDTGVEDHSKSDVKENSVDWGDNSAQNLKNTLRQDDGKWSQKNQTNNYIDDEKPISTTSTSNENKDKNEPDTFDAQLANGLSPFTLDKEFNTFLSKRARTPQPELVTRLEPEFWVDLPRMTEIQKVDLESETPMATESIKAKKMVNERLTFYFQGMPTLNFSRIEANSRDNVLVTKVKNIPTMSTDRIGVRLESGFTYRIGTRFSLLAGFLYFDQRQQIEYTVNVIDSLTGQQNGSDIVLEPNFSEELKSYDYQVKNVGVQLGFIYSIPSSKFETYVGSGVEIHKSVRRKSDLTFQEPDMYVFYNLFYRIEYPKEKKFRAMVQPTFNYSLDISQNLNSPIFVKPYGFGLNLGFTLKL